MTREERENAIRCLKIWIEKEPYLQIYKTCLEALEQEPSRDMKEIEEVINCDTDAETKCKMISNILTAEPHYFKEQEPKTGHWIRVTDKTGHLVWECDKCGWQQRFNTNFCPDCGCRMVEPRETKQPEISSFYGLRSYIRQEREEV